MINVEGSLKIISSSVGRRCGSLGALAEENTAQHSVILHLLSVLARI